MIARIIDASIANRFFIVLAAFAHPVLLAAKMAQEEARITTESTSPSWSRKMIATKIFVRNKINLINFTAQNAKSIIKKLRIVKLPPARGRRHVSAKIQLAGGIGGGSLFFDYLKLCTLWITR